MEMEIDDESSGNLAREGKIVLIGKLETCQALGNSIRKARNEDKLQSSPKIELAWSLSLRGVQLGSESSLYILIVIEPGDDWSDIATKELNYLDPKVLDNRCVDVVLWKKLNSVHQSVKDIVELSKTYKLLVHPIIADMDESVDINALKFYNRMKAICLHPEVNKNLFQMTQINPGL